MKLENLKDIIDEELDDLTVTNELKASLQNKINFKRQRYNFQFVFKAMSLASSFIIIFGLGYFLLLKGTFVNNNYDKSQLTPNREQFDSLEKSNDYNYSKSLEDDDDEEDEDK